MDKTEIIVDVASSNMLMGRLPTPAVVAVTVGLMIVLLNAWILPATNKPHANDKMGDISVSTLALAAKTIAPAVGRMNVWIMSLM